MRFNPVSQPHQSTLVPITAGVAIALMLLSTYDGNVVSTVFGQSSSSAVQRRLDYLVTFEITQGPERSDDQLTIIFSDRPQGSPGGAQKAAPRPTAPNPLFGDDIIQEFSFSGRDFEGGRLRFNRRVKDRSFVEARYIRLINHGADSWGGRTVSIWIDGDPFIQNASITMNQDPAGTGQGIQNYNRTFWSKRVFWETDLASLRRSSSKS